MNSPARTVRAFLRETAGAALIEFTIVGFALLLLTGGIIDFGVALFQWNAATKALQQGVRLASVSDPISSDLKTMTGMEGGAAAGDPFPAFTRVCSGMSASCSNGGTYSSAAMQSLVYGRGEAACGTVASGQLAGMCDVFWRITPANVAVTYQHTGLGFAGRPGGPVPTITLQLTGLTFSLPFLNGLLGPGPITMPAMRTSATGEDLSTSN
jgi:Flp pilus assembly protein TadG